MFRSKAVGATFLVAGTTIGAGMLGLPIVTAQFGIIKSILFLCFMWAVMCYSAILLLKLLSNFGYSVSVAKLSARYYGKTAGFIGGAAILVLFFSLLTAYLSASSGLISQIVASKIGVFANQKIIAFIITLLMLLLFLKRIKIIDTANRIIFTVKLICLIFALVALSNSIEYASVQSGMMIDLPQSKFFTAALIFFITFGFHGSIPALLKYLDNDYEKAKRCMIIGSFIPLILFLSWTVLALLVVFSQDESAILEFINADQGLVAFKSLMSSAVEESYLIFLDLFMLGAIFTSYFGVSIGLIDYIKELKLTDKIRHKDFEKGPNYNHAFASTLVVLLPFIISVLSQDLFIKALSLGAAMLSVIAIVLPSMVAIKMQLMSAESMRYKVTLPLVWLNLIFGVVIVLFEFL